MVNKLTQTEECLFNKIIAAPECITPTNWKNSLNITEKTKLLNRVNIILTDLSSYKVALYKKLPDDVLNYIQLFINPEINQLSFNMLLLFREWYTQKKIG